MTMVLEDKPQQAADTIHIVIADDQRAARGALRQVLTMALGEVAIREADDLASLCAALAVGKPIDLILLDLAMPSAGGVSGLLYLRTQHPRVPVLVISSSDDHDVMRCCIESGAAGFVPKDADASEIHDAVCAVLEGEIWTPAGMDTASSPDAVVVETLRRLNSLTPQQLRVLTMVSQSLLNKQIAYELKVSEATVKAHVSAILQKLGVDSRTQAAAAVSKIDQGSYSRRLATA